MKSLSPAMQAHLDEGTTTLAWCWRITRADGVTFGFTDHDRTLSFDGTDFEPESGLTASEVRSGSDLSVDAQDAEGVLISDRITETDILDGRWDNADVEVWRVNWADTGQRVLMRRGAIGQIRRGRLAFVAEVRSLAHMLGQTVGRTFQATCDAALGDARCGVDLEDPAYEGVGAVIDLLRDRAFTASGLTETPNCCMTSMRLTCPSQHRRNSMNSRRCSIPQRSSALSLSTFCSRPALRARELCAPNFWAFLEGSRAELRDQSKSGAAARDYPKDCLRFCATASAAIRTGSAARWA
jgi:hypothetical protein